RSTADPPLRSASLESAKRTRQEVAADAVAGPTRLDGGTAEPPSKAATDTRSAVRERDVERKLRGGTRGG
ncbi:MAG: hypothetical protein WB822_11970, partial [Rhodoplanes sp.]